MVKQKTLYYEDDNLFVDYVQASLKAKGLADCSDYRPILFHFPQTALRGEAIGFGRYFCFSPNEVRAEEILDEAEAILASNAIAHSGKTHLNRIIRNLGLEVMINEITMNDFGRKRIVYKAELDKNAP